MFSLEQAKQEAAGILEACGVPEEASLTVAGVLATADQYGVTSHGLSMLTAYVERVRCGGFNLKPKIHIVRETAAFAVIDGDNALGPVAAEFCMRYAVEKCAAAGMFTVFSRNNNTLGPAFVYPLSVAQKGYIGLVCTNSPAQMAPFGGCEKMLGTNPFAAVIPVPGNDPIIIDMATSVAAKSKILMYRERGERLPEGWALDETGAPTTDPEAALKGFILPMAGFKGYGLAVLFDILAGALSGASYLNRVGRFYTKDTASMDVGYCMTVIDPAAVYGEDYALMIGAYVRALRESRAAEGQSIRLPGDDRLESKRENSGC